MNEQHAILQIRQLEEQAGQIQARMSQMIQMMTEHQVTSEALKNLKKESETFSSIGAGVYAKTKVTDDKTVLVTVGNGIVLEHTIDNAQEHLQKNLESAQEELQKLQQALEQIKERHTQIMHALEQNRKK